MGTQPCQKHDTRNLSLHVTLSSPPFRKQKIKDDAFRSKFLWGRRPMLAACAARLPEADDMVWVDLGGGALGAPGGECKSVDVWWWLLSWLCGGVPRRPRLGALPPSLACPHRIAHTR